MTPESFLSWKPLIWGQGSEKHETSRVPAYLCFGVPGSSKDVAAFIVSGGTKVLRPELPYLTPPPPSPPSWVLFTLLRLWSWKGFCLLSFFISFDF